ncbi:biosynthetic peptidoglycan transglycosylase [uncultured Pedobacter sp.]|uniref:biosynthetic peptidoglycan transglycosylase n=1 Tax=uncultured Pedobacter sp. TaxID=246139 RepID=UPI0025FAF86A|nr:biosynthetic peptidoglycan transglycosylase [uncultured Pedobacter sp.]
MSDIKEIYYPLSKIEEGQRDIALLELQSAQNLSNSQTKLYTQFATILIGIVTVILTTVLNADKINFGHILTKNLFFLSFLTYFICLFLLRYFVDLQTEITINARKVVTLRAMLGLDYHSIQLTLPKDRIEGATNPFKIKFFNGWLKFQTIPFWMFLILVEYLWTLNFYTIDFKDYKFTFNVFHDVNITWISGTLILFSTYYHAYRIKLLDRNETLLLHICLGISRILGIKILKNFEYSVYRARLSYIEIDRLNVNYKNLMDVLITIEDSNFFDHEGISYKSLFRAILSQITYTRKKYNLIKSGGSTIEMQLSRTIFIPTSQNKFKRKILEFFMSRWLNQILSKSEILRIYIASVRYGYGLMGLSAALKRYFGTQDLRNYYIDKEHALFLVERLSNISGTIKWERVEFLAGKIPDLDIEKLRNIYNDYQPITSANLRV